jgi:hypothetical protein
VPPHCFFTLCGILSPTALTPRINTCLTLSSLTVSWSPALATPRTILCICVAPVSRAPRLASRRRRLAPLLLRRAEGQWLRPQAEMALIKAAREGNLATLTRLVEEGLNVNATSPVSAAPPTANSPLHPRPLPSTPAATAPPPPSLTAASDRVWRRRRATLRRPAGRPSYGRLTTASSTASTTSSPRVPS